MLDFLGRMFFSLMTFLRDNLGKVALFVVAPVAGFFTLIKGLFINLESYFNALISEGTNALGQAETLSFGTALGMANSIFPVDLCFSYVTILTSIWLLGLVYRAIKSWIPTVS